MKQAHSIKRLYGYCFYNTTTICSAMRPARLLVRCSASLGCVGLKLVIPKIARVRALGVGPTSKEFEEHSPQSGPLTKLHANELILRLTDAERKVLVTALQEFESNRVKEEFEDNLAGHRWRSKFGRPSKVPTLGDVDPTGTYCPVPEDWLKKKYAATVPKPTSKELFRLSLANSIPFIGFGFLDNFIMIIAGDSIESSMSVYITLSTMAAAALGNTFSDVIGIGSSYYVERLAALMGLSGPALSPVQLDMAVSRRFANMGRVVGITIGCFLGMTPLLFMDDEKKPDKKQAKQANVT